MRFQADLRQKCALFLFLAFPVIGPMYGADENSMLMGGLILMGNDGAAEAGENPAYLVFPKNDAKGSLNVRLIGEKAHNLSIAGLGNNGSAQWFATGDISVAGHHFLGKRFAVGLTLNDVHSPTYQSITMRGAVFNAAANADINVNNTIRFTQNGLAAGFAWKFSANESLGVKVKYAVRSEFEKSQTNFQTGGFQNSQEILKETATHALIGSVSYLLHTPRADFSAMLSNFGYQYQPKSYSYTGMGPAFGNVYSSQEYSNRQPTEPYFALGTRVRTIGSLNLFTEGAVSPPMSTSGSDNGYRDQPPKGGVTRTFDRNTEPGFAAGAGLSLGITETITLFAGARGQKGNASTTFFSTSPGERTLKTEKIILASAGSGLTWRRGSLLVQVGAQYFYQRIDISEDERYINGTTILPKTSNPVITVNGWGIYLGAAADF
jgi:hypothetical protein